MNMNTVTHADTRFCLQRVATGTPHETVLVTCKVAGQSWQPLKHLMYHSPDGFEWGYGGSGPADLARSMVGMLMDMQNPPPAVYQAVKEKLVACMPHAGGIITAQQVLEVVRAMDDGMVFTIRVGGEQVWKLRWRGEIIGDWRERGPADAYLSLLRRGVEP
jgi:hypothetical protein